MDSKVFEIFPALSKVLKKAEWYLTSLWALQEPSWELLAIAPINKHIPISTIISSFMNGANENTVA